METHRQLRENEHFTDDGIDFVQIFRKLRANFLRILGLATITAVCGVLIGLLLLGTGRRESKMRVSFAFPGFERGEYPDGSNFSTEDLRAPDVIAAALTKRNLKLSEDSRTQLRGLISIVPIISANIVKERDRLRAAGQTLPLYVPDEYEISISSRETGAIPTREREALLVEIVRAFEEKFRHTYIDAPPQFGNAFEKMAQSDYMDYELLVNDDLRGLSSFLAKLVEDTSNGSRVARTQAASFRSKETKYSFADLLSQTNYFWNVSANGVLSIIQGVGLSKDRQLALLKMDYRIRILEEDEKRLSQEEALVLDLIGKSQDRAQNYVLGIKSQIASSKTDAPVIDQGLLDSLVANDSYNFLVRKALDAGVRVRSVQAQKQEINSRRLLLEKATLGDSVSSAATREKIDRSIAELKEEYQQLWDRVRRTYEDYTNQRLANTIRITQSPATASLWALIGTCALCGMVLGLLAGVGLILLNIVISSGSVQNP